MARSGLYSCRIGRANQGDIVEFKRSAEVFVTGVSFFIGGPLLVFIGTIFATMAASRNDSSLSAVLIGLVVVGYVLGFVGFILLIVATHRALVKIDALPVRAQSPRRQDWPVS
jgi:hypothetical protein